MSLTFFNKFETTLLDCIVIVVISVCIKKIKIGEFCVAILILKMEKIYHIFDILCFIISRKVETQLKCKENIYAVYGEGAMADQTCQKWFLKFHAGDFSLDNVPQSGRPVEVDSDQIETLIENNQCYRPCGR